MVTNPGAPDYAPEQTQATPGPADAPEQSRAAQEKADEGGAGAGLLRLLTCQRRQPRGALQKLRLEKYRGLLGAAKKVADKRKDWYDKLCWWSDCKTKGGARIFVLAPRGPAGETDTWIHMWELLAYAVSKMNEYVVKEDNRFAVVWVQMTDHRVSPSSLWSFRHALHERYANNLEAVHLLHPSWSVRLLRLGLWAIADDGFWEKFVAHERIEFMDSHINMRKFQLPTDIQEFDKWLDKQAAEMNEETKKRCGGGFGGVGGMASEPSNQKYDEQMKLFKEMLEQKGKTD